MQKTKNFVNEFFTEIMFIRDGFSINSMLTASYMGMLQKMDPTFVASLLSGTLASYGISRIDKKEPTTKP